ncbi:zinc finger and BTB domain-containing protein 5 [Grus japonensis]|uniref:Zinc finger and BTB domain-containing protein 5 n=1 Tax=Grus japonensis TaxID=30415 RepID=A0ABC9VYQ7_GRUJA
MPEQLFPAATGEDHGRADIQPMEDPTLEQALEEAAACGEPYAGAGSWQERSPGWSRFAGRTCDPVKEPCWSSLLLKDCTPWKGPMLEQLVKNCSLWEGFMEKFMKECILWEGPHAGAREQGEEEGAAELKRYELTTTPIPHPPAPLREGRRRQKSRERRVKLSLERRRGWGAVLYFCLCFSLSYSIFNEQ